MDRDYSIYEHQRNIMRLEDLYEEKAWDRMIENSKKEQQEEEMNKKVDEILEKAQDYLKNNTKNITVKKLEAADLQAGEEERKAILVRNNAPENCIKCDFLILFKGQYFCMADGGEFILEYVVHHNSKPLDCPWKLLPDKICIEPNTPITENAYGFVSACGWNGCIEEIEGREEEESEEEAKYVETIHNYGVDKYVCPKCKHTPDWGANFCSECGQKLDWSRLIPLWPEKN